LTAADTVIIYDSDWNPQNDLQATARCHRIGQTKPVKIYRLITRGTYEQEMFTRASMKLGLDRAVLQTMAMVATDGGSSKAKPSLSAKEVESLLRHGAYAAFEEDDKRIEQFQADDIEQILSRSTTIVHDNGAPSEGASNFSKAAFVANKLEAQVNLDDPNFWQKLMPNQGNFGDVNINEFSFKRSRKTVLPPQKGAQRRIQSESVEDSGLFLAPRSAHLMFVSNNLLFFFFLQMLTIEAAMQVSATAKCPILSQATSRKIASNLTILFPNLLHGRLVDVMWY
jgi:hypothetical protein